MEILITKPEQGSPPDLAWAARTTCGACGGKLEIAMPFPKLAGLGALVRTIATRGVSFTMPGGYVCAECVGTVLPQRSQWAARERINAPKKESEK